MIKIQKIWACIVGIVSSAIGILRLFEVVNIPLRDALIHIATGALFVAGALFRHGYYVSISNVALGIFYIVFGIAGGLNWPHIILGLLSVVAGLFLRARQPVK